VITVAGRDWGSAEEIAERLGSDITIDCVREWAKSRKGKEPRVRSVKLPNSGRVYYPLDECMKAERDTRRETRGRPRKLTDRKQAGTLSPSSASAPTVTMPGGAA
jgi:hypothetical protein